MQHVQVRDDGVMSLLRWHYAALFVFIGSAFCGRCEAQLGPILSATGAVNRSMGGTGTAVAVSPAGPLLWNPAALAGLESSQLEFGAELLVPQTHLASSIPANSFGPGVPGVDLSGSTGNQDAVFALPTIALAYKSEDVGLTYGLGVFAVAGYGLDYPGSLTNPVLSPPPPTGLGFGPIYSNYQALQIAPSLVYEMTENFSMSFSPLLDLGMVQLDPAVFAAPDDANGDGFATYPSGTHSRTSWGAGFSIGAYYELNDWSFGACYKSPQWFQTYEFNTVNELGIPGVANFHLDLPAIISWGVAYHGFEDWLLAADFRYLDFARANGMGDRGFNPDGSLRGVGLNRIFALSLATQYQLTNSLSTRLGYSWSQNPVTAVQASANVASPLVVQHMLSAGATYAITPAFSLTLAYTHAFENSISGPLTLPVGPVPGTVISSSAAADMLTLGAVVEFGPRHLR